MYRINVGVIHPNHIHGEDADDRWKVSEATPACDEVGRVEDIRLEMASQRWELYVKPLPESIKGTSSNCGDWLGRNCRSLVYLQGAVKIGILVLNNQ
jgi:hypothetical protein